MPLTLTEAAALTKKSFVIGGVLLFVIIFGWLTYSVIRAQIEANRPKVEEAPDMIFGQVLPKPLFPKTLVESNTLTYELDTDDGQLPKMPTKMRVYAIPELETTLLAPDRAKNVASGFDFRNGPVILSPNIYRFTDNNGGEFDINIANGNFKYKRNIASGSGMIPEPVLPDEDSLIKNLKNYLGSNEQLPEDLEKGRGKSNYEAGSQRDSLTATVSIWQDNIAESEDLSYPIITNKYSEGLVKAIATKYPDDNYRFIRMNYTHWKILMENFATYPLRKIDDAFTQLKEGQGVVLLESKKPTVSLNTIYLAYYISEDYAPYLQPVYVFEGEDFAAIISAIASQNLEP